MALNQFDVEFTRDGEVFMQEQFDAAVAAAPSVTNMFVLAHGWNNNREEAQALYDRLTSNLEKLLPLFHARGGQQRKFGVVRIFWPSKRFENTELIPGGGVASIVEERSIAAVHDILDKLKTNPFTLGDQTPDPERIEIINEAKALVPALADDENAQREFVARLRKLLPDQSKDADDRSDKFFDENPKDLFERLGQPVAAPTGPARQGGATGMGDIGGATGLQDLFSGAIAAARRLANYTTYCDMKQRAGIVGSNGVRTLLENLREKNRSLKLHLVGHSFGGRLVTAAATALPPQTESVTLSLLQAAFSHNGFSHNFDGTHDGAFRTLLSQKRASGPIIITHTKNDQAVGIAYPLASRITRDQAADLGDENDPYGGIGRNGALARNTPEVDSSFMALLAVGNPYQFNRGAVYNLRADAFIKDHGDVSGEQVAYAILYAAYSV